MKVSLLARRLPFFALLLMSIACKPQEAEEFTADACDLLVLPHENLARAHDEAKRADVEAMTKLLDHYDCVDERKAAYWEDRLVEANEPSALSRRSSDLHLQASRLPANDPRKLDLLLQAQALEARGRKARGNGVNFVYINGKEVAVPYSDAPDEYTNRLVHEIDQLRGAGSR